MKKSTYFRIGVASLCATVIINSPFSHSSGESVAYLLGEFTGSFFLTYAGCWLMFKVSEMFNKA